jgi:hypothetical protein
MVIAPCRGDGVRNVTDTGKQHDAFSAGWKALSVQLKNR